MNKRHLLVFVTSVILAIAFPVAAICQDNSQAETEIRALLQKQTDAWNKADIDTFMQTYWNSPDLTFSSAGQTTRGWQATTDRYKKKYSSPELMGNLRFDDFELTSLSSDSALVLGTWQLTRQADSLHGNFSLVLRKFAGQWKIIHDHSSSAEE